MGDALSAPEPVVVVGVAIVRHGMLLAARRVAPADVAGGWELPGGKVEADEPMAEAAVREIREELGCEIVVDRQVAGRAVVKPGYVLHVVLARLLFGEPVPDEHDAVRWLGPEELEEVAWLDADRPFLPALREVLLDGSPMAGGKMGGAVRVGETVRRERGPWTPAVESLLRHLADRGVPHVPRVLGVDERGREVLSFLPGSVLDAEDVSLTDGQLAEVGSWTRVMHEAVADFHHPGPWRFPPVDGATVVGHNDLTPYNMAFRGDHLVGVFDWDVAGPTTPLLDLAFVAWNCVPLWRPGPAGVAARRIRILAEAYGGTDAVDLLHAVPVRVRHAVRKIADGIAAGRPGTGHLAAAGEPHRTTAALREFERRVPAVEGKLHSSQP